MTHLLALDLSASGTGFAAGTPGAIPRSGVLKLKDPADEAGRAPRNLGRKLVDEILVCKPDLIVIEAAISGPAQAQMGNAANTADLAWMLVGAVHAIAGPYDIKVVYVATTTHRKHFTGKGRWDSRKEAKRQTVKRCHQLKYFDTDDWDDNRADACSIFDWASHVHFKKALPGNLILFAGGSR